MLWIRTYQIATAINHFHLFETQEIPNIVSQACKQIRQ
jgi:hypothetical protein